MSELLMKYGQRSFNYGCILAGYCDFKLYLPEVDDILIFIISH